MNDPLDHMWKVLRADSMELADNPLLEKRLMQAMNKQARPRSVWRRIAIAAGILTGCLVLGGGIAMAAGYNPFRTFLVTRNANGEYVVTDEQGNPTNEFTITEKLLDLKDGTMKIEGSLSAPGKSSIEFKVDDKQKTKK